MPVAQRRTRAPDTAYRHRRLSLLTGALTALTGAAILLWPHASLTVVAWLVGICLLVNGSAQLVGSITDTGTPAGWRVVPGLEGVLSLLAGLLCLRSPAQALALIAGSWWIVSGVLVVVAAASGAFEHRRGWASALGLLSFLGGTVVLLLPRLSMASLVVALGVIALVLGCVKVIDAVRGRP
ncbi:HdeD family acid-resistance protein [Amycolatopsis magusensis]|uniref:HdeD family acid-resistance protein n=1 Tax=Amycolatopsis magusensis TaxID=882444 RepID=UPI0024A8E823|nr:DUF308 domain-containing protein [Amycolatopsis magusensis]MDI5978155.1 DUF308 domain-containing protein [Amycolatopsis magusensis]